MEGSQSTEVRRLSSFIRWQAATMKIHGCAAETKVPTKFSGGGHLSRAETARRRRADPSCLFRLSQSSSAQIPRWFLLERPRRSAAFLKPPVAVSRAPGRARLALRNPRERRAFVPTFTVLGLSRTKSKNLWRPIGPTCEYCPGWVYSFRAELIYACNVGINIKGGRALSPGRLAPIT